MAIIYNRATTGLFDNGCAQDGTDRNFSFYSPYSADSLSGSSCFAVDFNSYGPSVQGSEYIPVDPVNKTYQFAVSAKTIQTSYLGRKGSGYLGFAPFDIDKNFISHHQAYSTTNTVLTRAANPGDLAIYIARGDWYVGTTAHARTINFYPATHPIYNTVGGYTRFNMYNGTTGAYSTTGIVDIGGGEWRVDLQFQVPDWGYPLPIGTPVGTSASGGTYNYALGANTYPTEWTTYYTPAMTGYVIGSATSGASFRDQTKFIRFLDLVNYIYRTESAGDSARYLLDNIILIECPGGNAVNPSFFSRTRVL